MKAWRRSTTAWALFRGFAWTLLLIALGLGAAALVAGVVWNVSHRLF